MEDRPAERDTHHNHVTLTVASREKALRDETLSILVERICRLNPEASVLSLAQQVSGDDLQHVSSAMRRLLRLCPSGVHLGILCSDTSYRRPRDIVIHCKRGILLGPDNGILLPAARELGLDAVYEVSSHSRWLLTPSNTISAVEVYGSLAAYLSMGMEPGKVGPRVGHWVSHGQVKTAVQEGLPPVATAPRGV